MIDVLFGGGFSFAQAKLIDVLWDLIIGQGGRFLHGWLLYHYIVSDALVWTMEHSVVPYHYYTSLSFSTVSLSSLWSLGKMLARRRGWRTIMSALWIIFAITHVVAFATVWSAATGYLSPSTRQYLMPDQSLVPLDSEHLAMCWVLEDGSRLGLDDAYIEMGPGLDVIYQQQRSLNFRTPLTSFSSSYDTIWYELGLDGRDPISIVSEGFRNIYACKSSSNNPLLRLPSSDLRIDASTIRDMQYFLNSTGYASHYFDTVLTASPIETYDMYVDRETNNVGEVVGSKTLIKGLPHTLQGYQYSGVDQPVTHLDNWLEVIAPYAATFNLDRSISPGPGIIPYNSTFFHNGTSIALSAPFLNIGGKCAPHNNFFTSYGSCICYRGAPVNYDWFSNERTYCVSRRGYVWGFSSFLALVGLILEAVWAVGCYGLWLDADVNSELLKYRRSGRGVLRAVLDLAESVQRDLGIETCAYGDG